MMAERFLAKTFRENLVRRVGHQTAETVLTSPAGCAEIVAHCIRNLASGVRLRQLVDKPLWIATGSQAPVSLTSLATNRTSLDKGVIETINAAGITSVELGRMLSSAGLQHKSIAILLPDAGIETLAITPSPAIPSTNETAPQTGNALPATVITSLSLQAWRGAEQSVAMMLGEHGYQVEDRSRQNLGYDLYVEKDEPKHYVEVKLLDYAGQPFIITTNEEAVARGNFSSARVT